MDYIITTLVGVMGGGVLVYLFVLQKVKDVEEQRRRQALVATENETERRSIRDRGRELEELAADLKRFRAQVVSYQELSSENRLLKDELLKSAIHNRKLDLDGQARDKSQQDLGERAEELAKRYLKENVKWLANSLNPNNFVNCKQRLLDVIERCRNVGFPIDAAEEASLVADLKAEYERVVRAAFEREEQARIRAQIREEQQREREIQRQVKQAEREREIIKAALDRALAETQDQHSAEIERLTAQLAEAEAKAQRTMSQAQLTKAGHVYVISNIGSFGENIFKIGMTRRLEPLDRVCELGDASVPFPFDVHMMISCQDAPSLENALHRQLHKARINRVNPRREFFRVELATICEIVKKHHGEVDYVADAEALQYRQSLNMSEDDEDFIEHVYDELEDDGLPAGDDDLPQKECSTAPAT